MWQPQMERLADEFRVIAMDLPGHGVLKEEMFQLERSTERAAEVIDHAANGSALVVGLSLGGYIAMEFGARYPQKAAGLVIASASVEPHGWHAFPYAILSAMMNQLPEPWLNRVSRRFFVTAYGERRAQPLVAPGFFMRGGAAGIRAVMKMRFAPRLEKYPGPVLLLNGARDLGFRLHEKKFLAAAKNGRLQVIPRAFHLANIDQPEAFSEAVRKFANSIAW